LAYSELKDYQAAIANYNKAIEIDSNDADAYYLRGYAYYSLKDYQAAITDARKAAQLYQRQGDTERYQKMQQILANLEAILKQRSYARHFNS
jgi:tetratricopeptide (TPR) repeat protein